MEKQDVKWAGWLVMAATLTATPTVMAEEIGKLRINGFFSGGGSVSDSTTHYNESVDSNGSFNLTRLGINIAADIDANWSLATQVANHGFGDEFAFEWGFATYHHQNKFDIKLGKIKYPNGLFSEVVDVGMTYPWARPPQEFYGFSPLGSNMLIESYRGAAMVYKPRAGDLDLEVEPFYGMADLEDEADSALHKITGLRVSASASGEFFKVQAAYSKAHMAMASGVTRDILDGQDQSIFTVGGSLDWNNFVSYAEYGKYSVTEFAEFDTTAGYVSVGYRFGRLMPVLTLASYDQDSGLGQNSTTIGARYQLSPSVALKGEWQSIKPKERSSPIAGEMPAGLFEEIQTKIASTSSTSLSILYSKGERHV